MEFRANKIQTMRVVIIVNHCSDCVTREEVEERLQVMGGHVDSLQHEVEMYKQLVQVLVTQIDGKE